VADVDVQTFLQMLSPDDLRPASGTASGLEVRELDRCSPLIREVTLGIGRAHQWPSQRWDEQRWQTYLNGPDLRHWVAAVDGAPAGLLSLDAPPGGDVELDTFGLLPDHIGRGIGGQFLTIGVRLAWTLDPHTQRVWLHTSSRDHSHALPNYERRGFHRYQVEEAGAPISARTQPGPRR
jgi:GNAT superfamily N-acetyltransferase